MKMLTDAGIAISTKVVKWIHYSLIRERLQEIKEWFDLDVGLLQ